uniref:BPTI/Kunitz inhibitor domain-containing protein n=1 Tax=Plectus sambesii TaxID=2011161 RepID=A0A914WKZ8_9BILA
MFVVSWHSPTSAINLSSFLTSLWDAPQCEEFLSDAAWIVIDDQAVCDNAHCSLPREICMERADMAFNEGNRQIECRALPQECADAVNNGGTEVGQVDNGETTPQTTTPPLSTDSTPPSTASTIATSSHVEIITATDAAPSTTPSIPLIIEEITIAPEQFTTPTVAQTTSFVDPLPTAEVDTTEGQSTLTTQIAPLSQEDVCTIGRNMGRPGEGCRRTYNFFFDAKRKVCSRMLYWGCGGNINRFPSMLECEAASAHCESSLVISRPPTVRPPTGQGGDVCNQPRPVGRFCGYKQMFYYDNEQQKCQQLWFPGCRNEFTNDNLFLTAEECDVIARVCNSGGDSKGDGDFESAVDRFEKVVRGIVGIRGSHGSGCQQPRNLGYQNCPTGGWVRKFFFDTAEAVCKSFWYQGCGGNANRFDSITECRKECQHS